jgi:threonyl-tRNA synthetase
MSPKQVSILTVADKFDDYAKALNQKLKELDIRSTVDYSTDSLNKKVRNAETSKYNYVVIV